MPVTFTVSKEAARTPGRTLFNRLAVAELFHYRASHEGEARGVSSPDIIVPGRVYERNGQAQMPKGAIAANPFIRAAHLAFDDHYPLVFGPDDVWLCIAQGFALHMRQNAEALRSRFVAHEGQETIKVRRDNFVKGASDNDWQGVFGEFSQKIGGYIGEKKRDLVVSKFSTTGPIEKAASEIVLMDAMQSYFQYRVETRCGIPEVTLLGEVEDWEQIRVRAQVLSEFDLGWWTKPLDEALGFLVAAAKGKPDLAAWDSFFKYESMSGCNAISGWVNTLFPYLENPTTHAIVKNSYATEWAPKPRSWVNGPDVSSFPSGLSSAPFIWEYLGTEYPMKFVGGFAGVSQDPYSFRLRPAQGWAILTALPPQSDPHPDRTQTTMATTFHVQRDLQPIEASFAAITLESGLRHRIKDAGEARCGLFDNLIDPGWARRWGERSEASYSAVLGYNPFIATVHAAFDTHRPLVISPDDVWLCIAQGFANHVNANAETLRKQFVAHEGQKLIEVFRDEFVKGEPTNDWQGVFSEFSDKIAGYVGKKRDLVVADFSTTGPVQKAASEIVLMDAMQAYFSYRVSTMCGFPEITLLGEVEDWKNIRRRAEALAEFDLGWWVPNLLDVADIFVRSAEGKADPTAWQSFYKQGGGSGGPYVTGWINVLFPYVKSYRSGKNDQKNRAASDWARGVGSMSGGPGPDAFPSGLSSVPFEWEYHTTVSGGGKGTSKMELLGGFVGTSEESGSGALRTAQGWVVRDAQPPAKEDPDGMY
jgi:hypothetical protein